MKFVKYFIDIIILQSFVQASWVNWCYFHQFTGAETVARLLLLIGSRIKHNISKSNARHGETAQNWESEDLFGV